MHRHRIAILIDGGFLLKRLPKLVRPDQRNTPEDTARTIRRLCRNHIKALTGSDDDRWHQHVYRIFFYDAVPYDKKSYHPLKKRTIDFAKSDLAKFRLGLFEQLRKERKVALRLGRVRSEGGWSLPSSRVQKLLATRNWLTELDLSDPGKTLKLTEEQREEGERLQKIWAEVEDHHTQLSLRQKGVDMRVGLDIASITLKKQADTIVLVSGDSDFVPAAKLARREGMEVILDPLWQKVNADLFEHIDGLQSGLPNPKNRPQIADKDGANSSRTSGES